MKKYLTMAMLLSAGAVALQAENEIPTGDYYIRNCATGKFLSSGHDWGVMAAISDHAKRFTYEVVDGSYKLNTNLSGDNTSEHWFRDDAWIDNGGSVLQITWKDQANHVARIKSLGNNQELCQNYPWETDRGRFSDNYNDWNNENRDYMFDWQMLTKADLLAELTEATLGNPKDATFMIEAWDFGRHEDGPIALWNGICNDDKSVRDCMDWGYNGANYVGQKTGVTSFDIYQQLTDLPNGVYKLSVQAFYKAGSSEPVAAQLYANSTVKVISSIDDGGTQPSSCQEAGTAFNDGRYLTSLYVEVTDGTLRIGLKDAACDTGAWTVFDNFTLTYLGNSTTVAEAQEEAPALPNGTYYFRNKATGNFISQGWDWGTQLASYALNGLTITTTSQGNGLYTLNSNVFENANSHFIGTNGYVDGGSYNYIIRPAKDGFYTIQMNGVEGRYIQDNENGRVGLQFQNRFSSDDINKWEILTEAQLKAELVVENAKNPKNATFLLHGSNFGRHDKNVDSWQGTFTRDEGSSYSNYIGQITGQTAINVYQSLTDLPNGLYRVTAQAFYSPAASEAVPVVLYANSQETTVAPVGETVPSGTAEAASAITDEAYTSTVLVKVTDGTLTVGIKGADLPTDAWTVFDNFTITYYGNAEYVEVGQSGYATAVFASNVAPAEGLQAYTGTIKGQWLSLSPIEGVVPANTPVILKATPAIYYLTAVESASAVTNNDLQYSATDVTADGTQYILAQQDQTVGFYKATTGSTIKAGKVFLNSSIDVKAFLFTDAENATGNSQIENGELKAENSAIYNLSGQRVNKAQKGIFIQKGKKYLF